MSCYIVCNKKRNNPRMDVRICEKKCPSRGECKAFVSCNKAMTQADGLHLSPDSQPAGLEAA